MLFDPHLPGEPATAQIVYFLWRMAALQLLGMGFLGASHEGPREAGIGQRRGCRDRVSWRPHPAAGSHLPVEGTAPPFAVAPFRVVAPCPAPQKPHTPPRPTAGFRIKVDFLISTAIAEQFLICIILFHRAISGILFRSVRPLVRYRDLL